MALWVHCNACHNFWNTFPSKGSFFLSRCGHLLCSSCNIKALRSDTCLICKSQNVVTIDICSDDLPENIRVFFVPPDKVRQQLVLNLEEVRKHADAVREAAARVFECAKIAEFQNTNEFRLLLFTREEYMALTQRVVKAETEAKAEREKRMEIEEGLKRLQLEFDDYKRSHPAVNPFMSGGVQKRNAAVSGGDLGSAAVFDIPSHSCVPNTPNFHHGSVNLPTPRISHMSHSAFLPSPSPSPTPSNKALDAIRDITSAVQANNTTANRLFTSALPPDLRQTSVNSPSLQRFSSRGTDSRVSLKPNNVVPSSPAPSQTARIAVAAFQGKTRNECLQMTPGTVISDSCSVGSFDSPRSGSLGTSAVHRRPGSVVAAPSPAPAVTRTIDVARSTDHFSRPFSGNLQTSTLLSGSQSSLFKSNQIRH